MSAKDAPIAYRFPLHSKVFSCGCEWRRDPRPSDEHYCVAAKPAGWQRCEAHRHADDSTAGIPQITQAERDG